jgi:SHS2 domain-containing protein
MSFEFVENITSADVAFRAAGDDLNELFTSAADAVLCIMIDNPWELARNIRRDFTVTGTGEDLLLYSFLSEFLFYKDAESLLLLPEQIEIITTDSGYALNCRASGEFIDRGKHEFRVDIKAVTMHHFRLERHGTGWSAVVVLDV